MKRILIIFLLLLTTPALAGPIVLYDQTGSEIGTESNPLKVLCVGDGCGGGGSGGGFTDDGSAVRLTTSTDNVGIGTTNPLGRLQIGTGTPTYPLSTGQYVQGNLEVDGDIYGTDALMSGNVGIAGGDISTVALRVGSGGTINLTGANDAYMQFDLEVDQSLYVGNPQANFVSGGQGDLVVADDLEVDGQIYVSGVTQGQFLVAGANGMIISTAASGGSDNLGNHTATQTLNLSSNDVDNVADMFVDGTIYVGSGTNQFAESNGDLYLAGDLEVDGNTYLTSLQFQLTTDPMVSFVPGSGSTPSGDTAFYTGVNENADASDNDSYEIRKGSTAGSSVLVKVLTGGNVGIGTTSPIALLHVGSGTGTLSYAGTGDLYVRNDLEVDGIIYGDGSGISNLSSGGWTDDGTTVRLATSTDNVGIGTTTIKAQLTVGVAGTANYVDGSGDGYFRNDLEVDGVIYGNGIGLSMPRQVSFGLESPVDTDGIYLWKASRATTITRIRCIIDPAGSSESVVFGLAECDSTGDNCVAVDSNITCDNDGAVDDGSFTNASIDVDDYIYGEFGTVTGTVSQFLLDVYFTETAP